MRHEADTKTIYLPLCSSGYKKKLFLVEDFGAFIMGGEVIFPAVSLFAAMLK
jgi:hypothetical protein